MFQLRVNYSIRDFCEDVLKKRFPGDPIRQEINDSDDEKLNFACPYCGDSTKDPNKKRGNVYFKTNSYKCYNDGCATWVPIEKFISKFAKKYQLSLPSLGEKKAEIKADVSDKRKGFLIEFLINKEVGNNLLDFTEVAKRFSLSACAEANPLSPIGKYIESRKINLLPVFEQSCYYDSKHDKIYIFNLDIRSGKILGLAIRKICSEDTGPKYNIKNYSEFKQTGLVTDLDDAFIQKVDEINTYFNILNIDFSKDVTVTEGQIDSMFIRNCIAITGVTKGRQLFGSLLNKKNARVFFDSDKAGKEQSLKLLKQGYRVFLWTKALHDLKKEYSVYTRTIQKIKDVNDLFKFISLQKPETTFDQFNEWIDQYFSDSAFDLILV